MIDDQLTRNAAPSSTISQPPVTVRADIGLLQSTWREIRVFKAPGQPFVWSRRDGARSTQRTALQVSQETRRRDVRQLGCGRLETRQNRDAANLMRSLVTTGRAAAGDSVVTHPGTSAVERFTSRVTWPALLGRALTDSLSMVQLDTAMMASLVFVALATLQPAFGTKFSLVDDHQILSYSPVAAHHPQVGQAPGLLTIIDQDIRAGRFRPAYWAIRLTEIAVLGDSPILWHALYLLLGIASACLLYAALRAARLDRAGAFVAAMWLLATPSVTSVWIRLGTAEGLGIPLLAISLWAGVRAARRHGDGRWEILHVGAATAAMLTKESFVLAIPALVGFRLLVQSTQGSFSLRTPRTLAPAAFLLTTCFAVGLVLALIAHSAGTSTYGGKFLTLSGADLDVTVFNLVVLLGSGGAVLVLPCSSMLLDRMRGRISRKDALTWTWAVGLLLLLLLPQLALYRGNGFLIERYILPAGLAVAIGLGAAISWLDRKRRSLVWVASILCCLPVFASGALSSRHIAEAFRGDTVAVDQLVDRVVESAPRNATLLLPIDSVSHVELATSFVRQVAYRGRDDVQLRAVLLPGADPPGNSSDDLGSLINAEFPDRVDEADTDCSKAWGIVPLASESAVRQYMPCVANSDYARMEFPGRILATADGTSYILLTRTS